jgi:hypothetical protein
LGGEAIMIIYDKVKRFDTVTAGRKEFLNNG